MKEEDKHGDDQSSMLRLLRTSEEVIRIRIAAFYFYFTTLLQGPWTLLYLSINRRNAKISADDIRSQHDLSLEGPLYNINGAPNILLKQ